MASISSNTMRQLESMGLAFVFFAYWFFLRALAGVDASQSLALQFWLPFPQLLFPSLDIFTPVVIFILELLSWRVLRHFIPVLIALWLARRATIGLIKLLLSLPDEAMATNYLVRLQRAGTVHTPPAANAPAPAGPGRPAKSTGRALGEAAILAGVTVFLLAVFLLLQSLLAPILPAALPVSDLFGADSFLIWVTIWLVVTGLLYVGLNQPTRGLDGAGIQIRRVQFAEDRRTNPWLRVGGPGWFKVDNNDVIVTERNGRFWRVTGSGRYWLAPFETIRTVLDLRQQERENPMVRLMTKDGIGMRTGVKVTYRLARGDNLPSDGWPFPFDHDAVRLAAYQDRILPDDTVGNWEGVVLSAVVGQLVKQVAQSELDELVYPEVTHPSRGRTEPHLTLKEIMLREGRTELLKKGIDLLAVQLATLETSEPIDEQRVKYWQASWDKQHRIDAADSEAEAMRLMEFARAEGESAIIEAIMESIQQARLHGTERTPREMMALRMIESLERLAENSKDAAAPQLTLLSQMGQLRDQLNAIDDVDTT
jgi:hypothetical protein